MKVAPSAIARSIMPMMRSAAAWLMTGACTVAESVGSPVSTAATRARTRSTTSLWMGSCTSMRVGRPHPCPANAPTDSPMLNAQAAGTSASSKTMFADLPPSSMTACSRSPR